TLRARCEATFAWWNYGVKGWNGTAVSDATIQLRLVIETSPQFKFSLASPVPKLSLSPRISKLEMKIKDIDLRRIGLLTGDVVSELGDGSRKSIEALLQQQTGRIQSRLQKKIDEIGTSE